MFPIILDTDRTRRRPAFGVWALLILTGGAYVVSLLLRLPYGAALQFGIVPGHPNPYGLIAALFLHASGIHLLFNAFLLWFFGRDVEDALGTARFLCLYFVGGLAANLAQVGAVRLFLVSMEDLPIVGASGAVSIVVGAFAALFPRARLVRRRDGRIVSAGFPLAWLWGFWLADQIGGTVWDLMGHLHEAGYLGHLIGFVFGNATGLFFSRETRHVRGTAATPTGAGRETEDADLYLERAERAESEGDWRGARIWSEKALSVARARRLPNETWRAYRWLMERGAAEEISWETRLDIAALLQNEGQPKLALLLLQNMSRETSPEIAARALLSMSSLLALTFHDYQRAEESLQLIEGRYPQTRAAQFVPAQRKRIAVRMDRFLSGSTSSEGEPPDEEDMRG